ncbi:MAG: efflux RND transporter permease subunit, partial [Planctomycetota bacterium]
GALVVFGLIAWSSIGVDLFPRVEFPVITIITVLPGADPQTVETTVSDTIEQAVSTISGIKALRSVSADSVSQVIVEFELEKPVDVAFQEVQAKLGGVRSQLPRDVEDPVVEKFDVDSAPIMAVVVSGKMPVRDLTRLADKTVAERLQRVRNVGQVTLVGGRDREIQIWLDRTRLEGYQLAVQDVQAALQGEHIEMPGGRVETGPLELLVKTRAEFESADQIKRLIVAWRDGTPVRLEQVGHVEDGLEERRSAANLNGDPAVALLIRRQSGTNTVQVAHALYHELDKLRGELKPLGVQLEIAQDLSVFIEHSIEEIQFHLVFGGLLAVCIVFVFLRNFRITLISALAIPTSVIAAFIIMQALGFTMNMMTMLALSLSIGILIDDAIVVIENIYRHIEEGAPARQAATTGTAEIGMAAFAITMSIVAVFVPVGLMKGIVGRFFYQFGLTVAFAVMVSLFVAFTLTPMLSARILKHSKKQNILFRLIGAILDGIDRLYGLILKGALRFRFVVVLLAIGALYGAMIVSNYMKVEFIPLEDASEMNVIVKAPLGASLHTTEQIFEEIRHRIEGQPWLRYTFMTIGSDQLQRVNEGSMYIKMTPKGERAMSQQDAMVWVRERLAGVPNATISVQQVPRVSGGGRSAAPIQFEIRGPELDTLDRIASQVMDKLRESPGYVDIDSTYEKGKPEVNVYVKRDVAADLGVRAVSVASTVNTLIGGQDVAKFRDKGDRFDITLRLDEPWRNDPDDILLLNVRSASGQLIRMQNVARVERDAGPVQINRYNRTRQITLLANLDQKSGKKLGDAVTEINGIVAKMDLPPGYTAAFAGTADTMRESFGYMLFALGLAVILVYMVLASQFESFVHPFTIMLSLPLSVVGALGAIVMFQMTMSIFTMIGIIMLMGLVTKNAILLIDFTNQMRGRGMSKNEALLHAGPVRLRPILMTTLAMIFGMLPIALGTGAGSESRAPMAMAVIGGLITSTALTLLVVPVVYSLLDDLMHPSQWRIVRLIFGNRQRRDQFALAEEPDYLPPPSERRSSGAGSMPGYFPPPPAQSTQSDLGN